MRVELTKNEIRAIREFLFADPCSSGCAYEEMGSKNIECSDCPLTEAMHSILDKLN